MNEKPNTFIIYNKVKEIATLVATSSEPWGLWEM